MGGQPSVCAGLVGLIVPVAVNAGICGLVTEEVLVGVVATRPMTSSR